jgi:outer membrane protein assembly factor BamB
MNQLTKYLRFLLLLLIIVGSTSLVGAQDWTRFRGRGGNGIDPHRTAPVSWGSTAYAWEIKLPGQGNASPVVWGDVIFVTSGDDEKDLGYLFAVDGIAGKILWSREFEVTDLALHKDNKLSAASPTVDESGVYVIWHSKDKTELIALSHEGKLLWQSRFQGIESRHGGGSSVMIAGDYIVFTLEQEVDFSSLKSHWLAVEKHSGDLVWELERESPKNNSFGTPFLMKTGVGAEQLIFGSQSHGISAVDPKSGKLKWEKKDLMPARVVASPFLADGKVVMCCKGQCLVLELDPETGLPADTATYILPRNLSPYVPTPIAVGEYLYLFTDSGTLACVRLSDGELLWKERPAGAIYGSPIWVDGNLYCITKEGKVLVVGSGPSYQLKGIHDLGDESFSTPVMCEKGMVFRTFSKLILLGNN